MVKLVDMPDLGSGAARRVGSSPIIRTKSPNESLDFFLFLEAKGLGFFVNLFPAFHYIFFTVLFKKKQYCKKGCRCNRG